MTNVIPMDHVKIVCKIGQVANCCRYLGCGKNGFECLKHTELKGHLDKRVEDKTMHARADGCDGWVIEKAREERDVLNKQAEL